jgi:glycosyltransferase involved in cell wall biosynthesis
MISVLLATTGRPEQVRALIENLRATTTGHDVELVAAVDADVDTAEIVAAAQPSVGFRIVLDYEREYRGCSRAWNDALYRSTGDPVVLAADDLEFGEGWLDAALMRLGEFEDGWGFVGFNDGHYGEELSTHYLVSRRLIVEAFGGVIAWEAYTHSFNDREANDRARRAGRYAWCEAAHVHHRHWLFGERTQDATDTRPLGHHPASARAYEQRAAAGFPDDYEAVIA